MSRRDEYMKALEAASVKGQITPLAEFIAQEMVVATAAGLP
jgi:hypothetical protein